MGRGDSDEADGEADEGEMTAAGFTLERSAIGGSVSVAVAHVAAAWRLGAAPVPLTYRGTGAGAAARASHGRASDRRTAHGAAARTAATAPSSAGAH